MNQGQKWDGLLICFMHIENMNVHLCLYLLRHTCGSQRTTYTFGSFFAMCVLRIKFRSSDLDTSSLLTGPSCLHTGWLFGNISLVTFLLVVKKITDPRHLSEGRFTLPHSLGYILLCQRRGCCWIMRQMFPLYPQPGSERDAFWCLVHFFVWSRTLVHGVMLPIFEVGHSG